MVVSSKKKTTGKALVRQQVNTRDTKTGEDEEAAVVSEACSAYIFKFTDTFCVSSSVSFEPSPQEKTNTKDNINSSAVNIFAFILFSPLILIFGYFFL